MHFFFVEAKVAISGIAWTAVFSLFCGVLFSEMELWFDPVSRSGPEAMAIDQWLLETRSLPTIRIYQWDGHWGSLGYFGKLSEAEKLFPELQWVRRWTGGGIVDHRCDWTYSLIIPRKFEAARMKGGESYRAIHEILVSVLANESNAPPVLASEKGTAEGACFENPVEFDVIGRLGEKLAGAAQRRSKNGLLHQGSVSVTGDSRLRGELFAEKLSESWWESVILPDEEQVESLVSKKYSKSAWLTRC